MRSSTWQALGNTYAVVEATGAGRLDAERARAIASGLDGVVEVVAATDDAADVVIWNPDGSTAELSGNATRIVGAWLRERTGASAALVRVGPREVVVRTLESGEVEQDLGTVEIGRPTTIAGIRVIPVSVGNPHAVVEGDPDEIERIGPLLETHPHFPERTNVQVVRVDAPGELTARVWERGVGETAASGTSAVAVAAAMHTGGSVVVHFPGGDLHVRIEGRRAFLTGPPARRVPAAG